MLLAYEICNEPELNCWQKQNQSLSIILLPKTKTPNLSFPHHTLLKMKNVLVKKK